MGIGRSLRLACAFALATLLLAPRAGGQVVPSASAFAATAVPATAMPGGTVAIAVTGSAPGSAVSVSMASVSGPPLATGLSAADGSANLTVPVPTTQPLGDMGLLVSGTGSDSSPHAVPVRVTIVAPDMATTGASETVVLTIVGVGLLGLGFAFHGAAARRLAAIRARLAPVRIQLRLRRHEPARRVRIRPRSRVRLRVRV